MFGRTAICKIEMLTMVNRDSSFKFISQHDKLTPNLVTNGGQKHAYKVDLKYYSASVLVWNWFNRLFVNTSEAGRGPDPYIIQNFWMYNRLGTGWRRTVCPKEEFNAASIRRFNSLKWNQSYSMLFMKPLKPLFFVLNKGGRGPVVLHSEGRGLNTCTFSLKMGRSYNTSVNSSSPLLNRATGLGEIMLLKNRNTLDTNYVNRQLFRILRHDDTWVSVYQKLSASTGSKISDVDGKTIDGTSLFRLQKIKVAVLSGEFKWSNIKRVFIPKGGGKMRFLGIPTFNDRIVQGVLKLILEAIYEPTMSVFSHGFRPGKSQHSALRTIRKNFGGVKWIIEGDIAKFFDTVNWTVLMNILRIRIKDEKFLKLIQGGLKAKIILPDGLVSSSGMGISQGGIISPLLSNIYLDQMDCYINMYKKKFDKGERRANSSAYNRVLKTMGMSEVRKLGLRKTDPLDPKFRRLHYVRYANDFLIGLIGTKDESEDLKKNLSEFLRENLKLLQHPEKMLITNSKGYVKFLGYSIGFKEISYNMRINGVYRSCRRRILTLMVDMNKVIKTLADAKFCKLNGEPLPCFQYLHQPQSVSLMRVNAVLRGYVNYFRLCNNFRRSLNRIRYILQHSLAKMFAAKFKLKTRAAVFKIAGPVFARRLGPPKGKKAMGSTDNDLDLTSEVSIKIPAMEYGKLTDFPKPDLATTSKKLSKHFYCPVEKAKVYYIRGAKAFNLPCVNCGSKEKVEMHHVKAIGNLKKGMNALRKAIIASKRKQIPLCFICHRKEHLNRDWGLRNK
uniref:Reverse transcriptase domain-containing protein n=1 Tax=Rhizaria sp. TaxID=2204297 RepID=A0A5P8DJW8_9EUKA|nr:hypothetical protein [Rhizaria sp.]